MDDAVVALGREADFSKVLFLRVKISEDPNGCLTFRRCPTDFAHAQEAVRNVSLGSQNCHEAAHATDAWSSPCMTTLWKHLQDHTSQISGPVMTHNFHMADMRRSIDMMMHALSEVQLIPANETWESSVLHPAAITPSTPLARFVEEEINDAYIWNQIFRA